MDESATAAALIALAAGILVALTIVDLLADVPVAVGVAFGAAAILLVVLAALRSAAATRRAS